MHIQRTSESQVGQIYLPRVNGFLLVGVLLLVAQFRSSSALASAYGIAVSGTMVVTALMALVVIWKSWKWPLWAAAGADRSLPHHRQAPSSRANILKVFHGGWVPLLIGGFVLLIMLTWRKGARFSRAKTRRLETPIEVLDQILGEEPTATRPRHRRLPHRTPDSAPTALLHSLKHYKVLHTNNVILTIIAENVPRVATADRVAIEPLGDSFMRMVLRFGFMEAPNVPKALAIARKHGWTFDIMSTSFFLSRRSVRADARSRHAGVAGQAVHLCSRRTPTMPRAISNCRPIAWSRSAHKSPCSGCPLNGSGGIGEPVPVSHEAP